MNLTKNNKTKINNESVMNCHAFIIHIFFKKYMLHIWTHPYFSLAWHRKHDGLIGKLFWIERF